MKAADRVVERLAIKLFEVRFECAATVLPQSGCMGSNPTGAAYVRLARYILRRDRRRDAELARKVRELGRVGNGLIATGDVLAILKQRNGGNQ